MCITNTFPHFSFRFLDKNALLSLETPLAPTASTGTQDKNQRVLIPNLSIIVLKKKYQDLLFSNYTTSVQNEEQANYQ